MEAPALTINLLCGSGLKAVGIGFNSIRVGDSKVVLCGGMESMTQAEHSVFMRNGIRMGDAQLRDTMLFDGLTDAFNNVVMGITAEEVAKRFSVSREAQDEFALKSQQKVASAVAAGRFNEEIVPIPVGKKVVTTDEFPKPETTLESLKAQRTVFKTDGTVTPSNASGINDGAAALIIASAEIVAAKNLKPMVKIIGFAESGIEPLVMGIGPISAIRKLVAKVNWNINDVDLFEINEAFAAISIPILQELGIDANKVNVNGGSIALGHPIGSSGARVLVTLVHEMKKRGVKKGIASLCIGGGMGIAIAVENVL